VSHTSPTTATARPGETPCGPTGGNRGRIGIWVGITALGLILLVAGINPSRTEPGLIVFGAMVTSAGVSGLLGLAARFEGSSLPPSSRHYPITRRRSRRTGPGAECIVRTQKGRIAYWGRTGAASGSGSTPDRGSVESPDRSCL
jgi:hypothetical protein